MIQIYPEIDPVFCKCPACGCELSQPGAIHFQGIHLLGEVACTCCEVDYWHTFPLGHDAFFPVSFTKDGWRKRYPDKSKHWLAEPLIHSMLAPATDSTSIATKRHAAQEEVVLLNCLDNCWGHVFYKFLNAHKYAKRRKELGLILLIPANFEWMVPEGVDEIWIMDLPLHRMASRLLALDPFVKSQLERFKKIYVDEAHIQPSLHSVNLPDFIKVAPFPLDDFSRLPPQVTFVWREDRFWLSYAWEEWVYLAAVKWKRLPLVKPYFCWRQQKNIIQVARRLQRQFEKIGFHVAGLGTKGKMPVYIEDHRFGSFDSQKEKMLCALYARSHVVVGVHGSNMLLPTALGAAFVEVLPAWKLEHLGEDIAQVYKDRRSYFMGRIVEGLASSKTVSSHIASILKGYSHFAKLL